MASNSTIYFILSQNGIGIEFLNQWFTHLGEITKELFLAMFFKIARDEGFFEVNKIHVSFLNDRSLLKVMVVLLKMLSGVKPGIIHVFPLVTTLSSGFSWSHLKTEQQIP